MMGRAKTRGPSQIAARKLWDQMSGIADIRGPHVSFVGGRSSFEGFAFREATSG